MISKLLNIFRRVDAERQSCVRVLQSKHYSVGDNSSYSELTNIIKDNIPDAPDNPNRNVIEPDPFKPEQIYYENPSDDPEVWKIPEDWPDVEHFLHEAPSLMSTLNPTSTTSTTEYLFLPGFLILVEVTENAQNTVNIQGYTTYPTTPVDNTIYVGNSSSYNYSTGRFIRTSDGGFYDLYDNASHTHTWDTSKDIVVGNKHYRYVILYRTFYYVSAIPYIEFYNCGLNAIQEIDYMQLRGPSGTTNNLAGMSVIRTSRENLLHHKITDLRRSINASNENLTEANLNRLSGVKYLKNGYNIKFSEIDMTPEYSPTPAPSAHDCIIPNYTLNRFECNSYNYFRGLKLNYLDITPSIRYIKVPYAPLAREISTEATSGYANFEASKLKYIIVDENLPDDITYTIRGMYSINSVSGSNDANIMCPELINIEPYLYATTVTGYIGFFGDRYARDHLKFRTKGTSLDFLASIMIDTIELTHATELTVGTVNNVKCNKFILDKVTKITTSKSDTYGHIHEWYAPVLTTLSPSSTSYKIFGAYVTTLYLPALSSIPVADYFNDKRFLKHLTLGSDFNSSITLTGCWCLTKESLLDLFDKLVVIPEGETTKTITCPTYGPARSVEFTEEELAIATNKGWTVK